MCNKLSDDAYAVWSADDISYSKCLVQSFSIRSGRDIGPNALIIHFM